MQIQFPEQKIKNVAVFDFLCSEQDLSACFVKLVQLCLQLFIFYYIISYFHSCTLGSGTIICFIKFVAFDKCEIN